MSVTKEMIRAPLTDAQIEAITYEEYAKRQGSEPDFDCILKVVKRAWTDQLARNVNGITRGEFESHLRVCYQHDNVRAHVNASEGFRLTDEQKREVTERVDLNYPIALHCLGCESWDSGAAEVNFIQGCPGCRERMAQANGVATPVPVHTPAK
jgi:hypothetical protein